MRTEEYLLDRSESSRASEGLSWLELVVPGRLLDMIQNLLLESMSSSTTCGKTRASHEGLEDDMISRTQNISF